MTNTIVRAAGLIKTYDIDGNRIKVLRGIDLEVYPGSKIAVLGKSGAGKSTLLHQLGLLEKPTSGLIEFQGRSTTELNDVDRSYLRLTAIGFVFQFHHLLPEFSALENVMLPALMLGENRESCRMAAADLLKRVGLGHRLAHQPGELSGGEQQRVALARSLINRPNLILADEPTGNLDRYASRMMKELLWSAADSDDAALVIVTHDESIAAGADSIHHLADGRFVGDKYIS